MMRNMDLTRKKNKTKKTEATDYSEQVMILFVKNIEKSCGTVLLKHQRRRL